MGADVARATNDQNVRHQENPVRMERQHAQTVVF
jgi:hypothetical protein